MFAINRLLSYLTWWTSFFNFSPAQINEILKDENKSSKLQEYELLAKKQLSNVISSKHPNKQFEQRVREWISKKNSTEKASAIKRDPEQWVGIYKLYPHPVVKMMMQDGETV